MTQPAVADAAVDTGDDLQAEDAQSELAKMLDIPESIRASMSAELLATLPEVQPDADETPDESKDPQPDLTPDERLQDWVNQLDENPNILSRIPRAEQVAVVSAYKASLEHAAIAAVQRAYQEGMQASQQTSQLTRQVGVLDQLLEDGDHAAFKEAVQKFPGGEKNYYRVKADLEPIATDSPEHFQTEANRVFQELAAYPDEQQKFASAWNYTADAAGIRQLERDVAKALGRLEATNDPAAQALAKRTEATASRRALPKVDATSGGSGGADQPLTQAIIKTMTAQQLMKYTPDQLQAAMKR